MINKFLKMFIRIIFFLILCVCLTCSIIYLFTSPIKFLLNVIKGILATSLVFVVLTIIEWAFDNYI